MTRITPPTLGFETDADGWSKRVGGRMLRFRRLRSREGLRETERLQREVFGVSERDLISHSILVVVPETGGEIIGVFDGERMVGFLSAWGGFVAGRPRLCSDQMAVEPRYRGGVGFALKSLQAALALEAGFEEIVWTVDPLRAANAKLNFERLGAHAAEYRRDVYGAGYGEGLYGGMPTDRLLVTWPIASERVRARLSGRYEPLALEDLAALPDYGPGLVAERARIGVPSDIDELVAREPTLAIEWRFGLRGRLESAFTDGYAVTGFAGRREATAGHYLLEQVSTPRPGTPPRGESR